MPTSSDLQSETRQVWLWPCYILTKSPFLKGKLSLWSLEMICVHFFLFCANEVFWRLPVQTNILNLMSTAAFTYIKIPWFDHVKYSSWQQDIKWDYLKTQIFFERSETCAFCCISLMTLEGINAHSWEKPMFCKIGNFFKSAPPINISTTFLYSFNAQKNLSKTNNDFKNTITDGV